MTGAATDVDGVWRNVYVPVDTWKGQTVRILFEAVDGASEQPGRGRDRRRPDHPRHLTLDTMG